MTTTLPSKYPATSASGAMLLKPAQEMIICGLLFFGIGAATSSAAKIDRSTKPPVIIHTSSGIVLTQELGASSSIAELRRLSGLTWDQLANIFQVSRRSLHFWASGATLTPGNEEKLNRVLTTVRKINKGSAAATRSMLLSAQHGGKILVDLLAAGEFNRVIEIAGQAVANPKKLPPRLSASAMAARMPPSPADLIDARQDTIHKDVIGGRSAKSVRVRGSGRA